MVFADLMMLDLAPHIEEALRQRAVAMGLSVESLIEQFVAAPLATSPVANLASPRISNTDPSHLNEDITFLQTAVNIGMESMWVVEREDDGRYRVTYMYSTVEQYAPVLDSWVGKRLDEIFDDPDFVAHRYARLDAFLDDPSQDEFAIWMPMGDEMAHVTTRLARLEDKASRPRILGVTRDITAHIHTEQALAEREREYHSILEHQRDLVCRYLPDTTIVYVNEAYCRFFGVTREDIIGRSFLSLISEAQHEPILKRIAYVQKNPTPSLHEMLTRRNDGEMRVFQWMDYGITGDDGQVKLIQAVGHDITEMRQMQQQFQETQERYRIIVEAATDGILLVGHDGTILMVNPCAEQMFGYASGELDGQVIESLVPLEQVSHHPTLRNHYEKIPVTRPMGGSDLDLKGRRKDGSVFPVDVSLSPVDIGGQQITLCIVKDMTLRAELEAQHFQNEKLALQLQSERELIELRERFVSMVAHEFRTPLSVIQTAVDMVSNYYDRLDKETVVNRLSRIPVQIDRMRHLIDDVLEISRPTSLIKLDPQPLALDALCESVLGEVRATPWGEREIILDIDDAPEVVRVDGLVLAHVLSNLLINAIKYSPDGQPVTLRARKDNGKLRFDIMDRGIGIPPEDQPHIFEPFRRANNTRDLPGNGLGLAVVKQNVEAHGGTIAFESIPGEGATFSVVIPL